VNIVVQPRQQATADIYIARLVPTRLASELPSLAAKLLSSPIARGARSLAACSRAGQTIRSPSVPLSSSFSTSSGNDNDSADLGAKHISDSSNPQHPDTSESPHASSTAAPSPQPQAKPAEQQEGSAGHRDFRQAATELLAMLATAVTSPSRHRMGAPSTAHITCR
jgi:hypothetical protein